MYLLSEEEGGRAKPLTSNFQPQMFCNTWDFPALLQLKGRDLIMPGEDATINLAIKAKMVSSGRRAYGKRKGRGLKEGEGLKKIGRGLWGGEAILFC